MTRQKKQTETEIYNKHLEIVKRRQGEIVTAGQDIGEIPDVANPKRRSDALASFKTFCLTYFPDFFYMGFSPDHEIVLQAVERVTETKELFALAMCRGSGKTTIFTVAVIYCTLSGKSDFTTIIAVNEKKAVKIFKNIKMILETNEKLLQDFPEAIYPIKKLERTSIRAKGQKYHGEPTFIEWSESQIVFANIPGALSRGAVITCCGLDGGNIRGQQYVRPDGTVARPKLVLVDDPQSRESAKSPLQCDEREQTLDADVLCMSGPGKKLGVLMAVTVIAQNDLADRMLDRKRHPEWHGRKFKMLYNEPTNIDLWDRYSDIRRDEMSNDGDGHLANEFYLANRDKMDEGAVVGWKDRYDPDEISAVQHAMNLKIRDEKAFYAEYQNEPLTDEDDDTTLTAVEIAERKNGYRRGEIPQSVTKLTMFIDVHKNLLYWCLCGWEPNFTGYVIDYGTYPDQNRMYFMSRDVAKTIQWKYPKIGEEGALYKSINDCVKSRLGREYQREDGVTLHIDKCLIDAGYLPDVVYRACRESEYTAQLLPSNGHYVGVSMTPFSDYRRQSGDEVGEHWRIPSIVKRRNVRHVLIDTNYWKMFCHSRLKSEPGSAGSLTLWGKGSVNHQLFAEHLTAEKGTTVVGKNNRTVVEWNPKPNRPDNHWFDCLVGCMVAASVIGVTLKATNLKKVKKERVKLSELLK